jgi:hypothetical protein
MLSLGASAATWESGGIRFGVPENFGRIDNKTKDTATQIAAHIKRLRTEHFNDFTDIVSITFEATRDSDALFYPAGLYEGSVDGIPVEHAVISLNPRLINDTRIWRLVGHEFFHAVHHKNSPRELSWVREGLAQKFEYDVYGAINPTNVRAAISGSRRALEEDFDTFSVSAERYGNTFLFFQHWESRCGTENIWEHFLNLKEDMIGSEAIDTLLQEARSTQSACVDAKSLMTDFVWEKLINQRHSTSPRALWPELPPMAAMRSVADSLNELSAVDELRFFSQLPAFLGLKFPQGVWRPKNSWQSLRSLGVEFRIWDPRRGQLRPWNGSPLPVAEDAYLLLTKGR